EERTFWEAIASQGAMRSYILEHEGCPLAFMLASQWKKRFVPEEIGYDPSYAAFAPGTVLYYRLLEDLIAHDTPELLDLGFGDNEYKRVFGNEQTMSTPVILATRGWRNRLVGGLGEVRSRLGRPLRACLQRMGLTSTIRRLFRR